MIYLALLARMTRDMGLDGAGYAVLIGTVANAVLMLAPTLQSYRARHLHARNPRREATA